MSVVENQREEGKLHLETLARKYLQYAVNCTRGCFQKPINLNENADEILQRNIQNDNVKWYADKLREYAVELLAEIMEANSYELDTEYAERLLHQKRAISCISKTKVIITELHDEHIIKSKKLKAWLGEIKKVKDPLYRWKQSDNKRKMGNC